MKPWIKKALFTVFGATIVLGGLSACGARGDHSKGWSDERVAEMRGKVVERIGSKLELNDAQKQKLGLLADEMLAARKAMRGNTDVRSDVQALLAGEKFDRSKAQLLLDQKTQALQSSSPKLLSAFGDFYDSLSPAQQTEVREVMQKRGHGWWGRG